MLKQKLMLGLGPLVLLLVLLTCASIFLIEGMLSHFDEVNTRTGSRLETVEKLADHLGEIEAVLLQARSMDDVHPESLAPPMAELRALSADLRQEVSDDDRLVETRELLALVLHRVPEFLDLASVFNEPLQNGETFDSRRLAMIQKGETLEHAIMDLSHFTYLEGSNAQLAATRSFRWQLLATSVIAILLINVAILILLRTAGLVIRPVERLVDATRRLGQEEYGERVEIEQHDEFEELADAYNRMAAQLQQNEARKIEALKQVALTLNHELNNALEIIELQLQLAARRPDSQSLDEDATREIRAGLKRMASTVESLKHVRRIVLTDYGQGQKMLDLSRSTCAEEDEAANAHNDDEASLDRATYPVTTPTTRPLPTSPPTIS